MCLGIKLSQGLCHIIAIAVVVLTSSENLSYVPRVEPIRSRWLIFIGFWCKKQPALRWHWARKFYSKLLSRPALVRLLAEFSTIFGGTGNWKTRMNSEGVWENVFGSFRSHEFNKTTVLLVSLWQCWTELRMFVAFGLRRTDCLNLTLNRLGSILSSGIRCQLDCSTSTVSFKFRQKLRSSISTR